MQDRIKLKSTLYSNSCHPYRFYLSWSWNVFSLFLSLNFSSTLYFINVFKKMCHVLRCYCTFISVISIYFKVLLVLCKCFCANIFFLLCALAEILWSLIMQTLQNGSFHLKYISYTMVQSFSFSLKVRFTLSKWPHFNSAY